MRVLVGKAFVDGNDGCDEPYEVLSGQYSDLLAILDHEYNDGDGNSKIQAIKANLWGYRNFAND